MISDAYVDVTCDSCSTNEQVQLTAIARKGYDMRNVARHMKSLGWKNVPDGSDFWYCCPDCVAEAKEISNG